jgi:predicted enzyme related to lactoylglutathione lyase
VAVATSAPRLTSLAPQLLVDDLDRAIAFYRDVLEFSFSDPWQGFYAIGVRDGFELHLKQAPKTVADRKHRRDCQHLDVYAGVDDIDAFYAACLARGAEIIKPLAPTAWGTKDFYIVDQEGYILGFGGSSANH